jgi:hypothetical protein
MRKALLFFTVLMATFTTTKAIDKNTVEILYDGMTATVNVAPNISNYVTVQSGTSSHVRLIQSENFAGVDATADNEDGEIIYILTGSSTDGEFYLEGSFKATVELNGVSLTNPSGPAIAIMDGKRIAVSIKKDKTNKLADGINDTYNGCFHCKGHTKFKGKGTLNVTGNSKHAIYSKEYMEVKNCTINITAAAKDGIHCKEYFFMESGTISITAAGDDGIQVELANEAVTGETIDHEEENTGNFYQEDGTISIRDYQGSAIKADGTVTLDGKYTGFTTEQVSQHNADGIAATLGKTTGKGLLYDLSGCRRSLSRTCTKGIYVLKADGQTKKIMVK